ncbi:MAG: hypothetical protein ACOX51_07175 [Myxococcota bacterium]|jgi:hypothetical protein
MATIKPMVRKLLEQLLNEKIGTESGRLDDPMPSGGAHWVPDPSKAVF